jgi:hypothetical protein
LFRDTKYAACLKRKKSSKLKKGLKKKLRKQMRKDTKKMNIKKLSQTKKLMKKE